MGEGWYHDPHAELGTTGRRQAVPPGIDGSGIIQQPFGYYPSCSLVDRSGTLGYGGGRTFNPYLSEACDQGWWGLYNQQLSNNRAWQWYDQDYQL